MNGVLKLGIKLFTEENLRKDDTCELVLEFVLPLIEEGKDIPTELVKAGQMDWLSWAIRHGYDCASAWREMDSLDNSLTWDAKGRIFATAGDWGTAIAGKHGTATAGYWGTAIAGEHGTATAGYWGALVIVWWDGTCHRRRTAEVDGERIKANTPYKLNAKGEFVEASA